MTEKRAAKKSASRKATASKKSASSATKKSSAGVASSKKRIAKASSTAKKAAKKQPARKPANKAAQGKSLSRDKAMKDPRGGLTEAGRVYFNRKEGSHLKPGVKGAADTPEKKKRKGSFLRRHFANPRGPMEQDGEPTRLALSAQAWGEPLPKTSADAKKLAAKGSKLLKAYKAGRKD